MTGKARGAVVERVGRDGLIYRSLRFTAAGKRRFVALGTVSATEAATTLRHTLADVERGTWTPPQREVVREPDPVPTFHEFAEQWWVRSAAQFRAATVADYRWRLEHHLLPFFGERRLDEITYRLVEEYVAAKLGADRPLAPRSINMTVSLLGQILEGAVESELIARNPARGRRRKAREHAPKRTYIDTAEHIRALFDAAGERDSAARPAVRHIHRRAMIAVLILGGLRIGELTALRWRDVDLATGWLTVGESKTDAGRRRVKIRGALRDELAAVRVADAHPDAFVFASATGSRMSPENIRNRVLAPAVEDASKALVKRGLTPLPDGLTPHSLRRTFASVLYALGEDPGVVMDEMGHTDPGVALGVYRQTMRRDDGEKAALRALVDGADVAFGGTRGHLSAAPTRAADGLDD